MRKGLAAAVVLVGLAATGAGAQMPREPSRRPPPRLVPPPAPQSPYRICATDYGACVLPTTIAPGTPCSCWAPPSWVVPGVAHEFPVFPDPYCRLMPLP
jgi:hypothetical protein